MDLTAHHFQRLGAHAAAALAHRDHPRDLTDADLDKLVQLTASAAGIAARAVKGKPGWIWQQKLAAMYPQSPPTAPRRGQFLARGDDLEGQVRDLFAGDPSDGEPCWTCGHPAGARWGKSLWPLTDSGRYRNHATGGAGGYPACRRCRIAVWCLPWAVGYRSGSIVTISGSEALEADWARRQVQISREALRSGWTDWATGSGPLGMLRDLVCEAPQVIEPFEVQRWSSDNRGAWLSTAALTHPGMVWLRAVVEVGAERRPGNSRGGAGWSATRCSWRPCRRRTWRTRWACWTTARSWPRCRRRGVRGRWRRWRMRGWWRSSGVLSGRSGGRCCRLRSTREVFVIARVRGRCGSSRAAERGVPACESLMGGGRLASPKITFKSRATSLRDF